MTTSNDDLDTLLQFDPLARAEQITGVSYKEDEGTVSVGLILMQANSQAKEAALRAQNDSVFSNKLDRYLEIIAAEGFYKVYETDIPGTPDRLFMFWHDDGILLKFDTYWGDSVNGGKFWYNWKPKEGADFNVLSSHGPLANGIVDGDHDCREAIRYHLRRLREEGQFVNPWVRRPFLWLLHYQDTKDKNYDYRAITNARIAELPEHVQKSIGLSS